jgi:hypothetical protein
MIAKNFVCSKNNFSSYFFLFFFFPKKQDASQRYKLNTLVMFPVNGLDMSRHVQKSTTNTGSWSESNAGGSQGMMGNGSQRQGSTSPHSRTSSTSSVSAWLTWKPGRKAPEWPNDYLYDLYAVCNHYGNMQGGHYTGTSLTVAPVVILSALMQRWSRRRIAVDFSVGGCTLSRVTMSRDLPSCCPSRFTSWIKFSHGLLSMKLNFLCSD